MTREPPPKPWVLFRQHRGALAASLDTCCVVADREGLVNLLREICAGWPDQAEVTPQSVTIEPYGHDTRIDWDTHIVKVAGTVVGFTSGPLEPA